MKRQRLTFEQRRRRAARRDRFALGMLVGVLVVIFGYSAWHWWRVLAP